MLGTVRRHCAYFVCRPGGRHHSARSGLAGRADCKVDATDSRSRRALWPISRLTRPTAGFGRFAWTVCFAAGFIVGLAGCGWDANVEANLVAAEPRPSLDQDLAALAKAGPNGAGSAAAQAAADRLRQSGPELLPRLLRVMDDANAVGANWARTVFEDIADRAADQNGKDQPAPAWPLTALQDHIRDRSRSGRSRRLALRLVERLDPAFAPPWLLSCRDDPEFRIDAVDATLRSGDDAAKAGDRDSARKLYRLAFSHARESDQVLLATRKLSESGEAVDPIRHLGLVTRWHLVGPFDAPGTSGFDTAFPPQDLSVRFDPQAKFTGTTPAGNGWKKHETRDRLGQVDLIQALAAAREAVGYAYAELDTPLARAAQLRCSADDNLAVWLNGQQVLARRQWLNGTRLDRFIAPIQLQAGVNRLLVKICQGPQHADPAVPNNWSFQLRLCDETGAGIPFTIRSPEPAAAAPATSVP